MLDQVTPTASISTAADLAKLQDEGRALNPQELKELNTRVQALEEMAKLEDRLKALEKRKRPRSRDPDDRTNRLIYSLSYCQNTSLVAIKLDSLALYTILFNP